MTKMKYRAFIIGISLGLMILSVVILVMQPTFGRENLGVVGMLAKNASPILMLVSGLSMVLFAGKLRITGLIGILLIIGSLTVSYFLSERTGYSIGTSGWNSMSYSMFIIIPIGLLLCFLTGFFSLLHII
ncbi:MAG: hypothetical protein HQK55_06340, partial [Deltaproteobacteria bacterium]|nr:hypothetical protein [Deltaproteobacteria bacterium]